MCSEIAQIHGSSGGLWRLLLPGGHLAQGIAQAWVVGEKAGGPCLGPAVLGLDGTPQGGPIPGVPGAQGRDERQQGRQRPECPAPRIHPQQCGHAGGGPALGTRAVVKIFQP